MAVLISSVGLNHSSAARGAHGQGINDDAAWSYNGQGPVLSDHIFFPAVAQATRSAAGRSPEGQRVPEVCYIGGYSYIACCDPVFVRSTKVPYQIERRVVVIQIRMHIPKLMSFFIVQENIVRKNELFLYVTNDSIQYTQMES